LPTLLLAGSDLACARGPAQILAGVRFAIAPGEALILRGPNGAGKTTLLRTLAGLTPPLAGQIDCLIVCGVTPRNGQNCTLRVGLVRNHG